MKKATLLALAVLGSAIGAVLIATPANATTVCHSSYPNVCIPVHQSNDLDCKDIPQKNITVTGPDFYELDKNENGVGCEDSSKPKDYSPTVTPTVSKSTKTSSAPVVVGNSVPTLPVTGASITWFVIAGVALVGAGAGVILFLRRRRDDLITP